MPKPIPVYWFAPYDLSCPSTRYRGKLPLDLLEKQQKITATFFYPQRTIRAYFHFLILFFKVLFRPKESWLVIQKVCSNRYYAKLLKLLVWLRPQKTLYDLDDAEYYRQPTQTLHFFLKNCALIQVGSHALAQYAKAYNQQIYINTSPVSTHHQINQYKNKILTLGWVGDVGDGKPTSRDFAHKTSLFTLFFPALLKLTIPVRLVIVGVKKKADIPLIKAYFSEVEHIEVVIPEDLCWEQDDWLYTYIKSFDVGISPLVAHPFNVAKSAFKAKQYLSCGVPTIASDVGENKSFVQHQKNGLLCDTIDDFVAAISYFSTMDAALYQQFVEASLDGIPKFSMPNYCTILYEKINCH